MTTALYRVSSQEVLKVSALGQPFADRDPAVFGVLTDPTLPDGTDVRERLPDGTLGPARSLGFAKIAVVGTNTVRNATTPEIATFAAAETADENALDALDASRFVDNHPRFRKVFKALVNRLVVEHNAQADLWAAFKTHIAAATNLADLKTRIATMNPPGQVTRAQAITALKNDISGDD